MTQEIFNGVIEHAADLTARAIDIRKSIEKIKETYYDLLKKLDDNCSVVEHETAENIRSAICDIDHRMEEIIYIMKRLSAHAKLNKCDRFMVTRINMAICEINAVEKEIEMLNEMPNIK